MAADRAGAARREPGRGWARVPRGALLLGLGLALLGPPGAAAQGKKVKIGVLKLSNPVFSELR